MIAEWILARGFITHLAKLSAAERPAVQTAVQLAKIANSLSFRVQEGLTIDLVDALQECSLFKASFHKDKVYALMGFTGDVYHHGIQPHYDESIDVIYKSTTAYLYSSNITRYNARAASTYPL